MGGNDLAPLEQALPGLLEDEAAKRVLAAYAPKLIEEGGKCLLPALPSKDERVILTKRLADLRVSLRKAGASESDRKKVSQYIATLVLNFPNMKDDELTAARRAAIVSSLCDLPLFAVREACEDIARARVEFNPNYFPTGPLLVSLARKHEGKVYAEMLQVQRVLDVRAVSVNEMTIEQRQAMGARFAELAQSLQAKLDISNLDADEKRARRTKENNDRVILGEYERLGLEPVYTGDPPMLISPHLAKHLPKPPRRKAR